MVYVRTVSTNSIKGRNRTLAWVGGGVATLGVLGLVGVLVAKAYLPGYVMGKVQEAALERGVSLTDCALEYERSGLDLARVTLTGCHVATESPGKVRGVVERIAVDLRNNAPVEAFVAGGDLTVTGNIDWEAWKGRTGEGEAFAVLGQRNTLAWVVEEGRPAAVTVSDVQKLAAGDDWGGKLDLAGVLDGTLRLGEQARVELRLRALPQNTLTAEVDPRTSVGHVRLELSDVPFMLFSGILFGNVPAELATTTASGTLSLDLPYGLNPAEPKGSFDFTLAGLTFPVPRELAGMVYDTSPHLSGQLASNRTYTKFEAHKVRFETGALHMKGKATVQRDGADTHWSATMQGPLPCDAIVAAAARVHLSGAPFGKELATAAARISKRALKGSVNIMVALDADSRDLAGGKLVKSVGFGCGLEPLPLPGLKELPAILLQDLPQLAELPDAGSLPKPQWPANGEAITLPGLPGLPKGLPGLELPGLQRRPDKKVVPQEPKSPDQ